MSTQFIIVAPSGEAPVWNIDPLMDTLERTDPAEFVKCSQSYTQNTDLQLLDLPPGRYHTGGG